jgi:hypothetical protein
LKILLISHGFYPEQTPRSFRATELAKEFSRQGHIVTVIAPYRFETNVFANLNGFNFKSLGELNWKIYNFKSLGFIGKIYNKIVNRFLPLLFEYPMMELFFKVRKSLKFENKQYDLLISIAVPYPIHWGVASIWYKNKKNIARIWVADCGDPYCLQENDTIQPPFYFRYIEKWFMNKANFISVPTKNSFKGFNSFFHYKMRIIPQGFRFDEVERVKQFDDGIMRFGYGGSFIPGKRDPSELIVFLINLPTNFRFEFHIYTSTPQFVYSSFNLDNRIFIHRSVSRLELLKTFSTFNFVVNFSNKGVAQTPSKLIDYGIIEKPILNIDTGDLNMENVLSFLKGDFSKQLVIDNIDSYRIENVTKQFLKLANQNQVYF